MISPGTGGIDRREFIKLTGGAAAAAALTGALGARASAAAGSGTPNIVLVITDQQHIESMSGLGCPYSQTPGMDRIAQRGTAFMQSHCGDPVCGPSRSTIFTGRMASETGVTQNGHQLRDGIPNIGQWLSEHAGYETIYAGKWHVKRCYTLNIPGFHVINTGIEGQGNLCDSTSSRACEGYLRNRSSSRPFFMVASYLQPHDICEWLRTNMDDVAKVRYADLIDKLPPLPANFRGDWKEPAYQRELRSRLEPALGHWSDDHWRYYLWCYYRHVEEADAEVGRIVRALEETGQDKNTVLIFTADHGEGLARHQMVRKSFAYDEAVKVPFVISSPGRIPEGKVEKDHLITSVDIMPTICDYAGVAPPPKVRGRSLRPFLEGRPQPSRFVVSEIPGNVGRALRSDRFKYITYVGDPVEQLFDMQADSGETKNLAGAAEFNSTLQDHRKLLRDWEHQLDPSPDAPHTAEWRKV